MSEEQTGQEVANEQVQEELSTSKLPEDASDRTKEQFEKLLEHNKQLKEELEAAKASSQKEIPSVIDSLNPKATVEIPDASQFSNLNQDQVNQVASDLTYKGKDGFDYVDTALLNKRLQEANQRAEQAQREAQAASSQFQRYQESLQLRDAYQKYPQLDPNNKEAFDPHFYDSVKGELMLQAMQGKKDLVEAARVVDERFSHYRGDAKTKKESEEKAVKKEQINGTGTASTSGRYSNNDSDYLRTATMQNKPGALAERLRRSGY